MKHLIKKHFYIPITHLPPIAPNLKKMPPIYKTFLNSTNKFAPNWKIFEKLNL